jgi:hypothetical protein
MKVKMTKTYISAEVDAQVLLPERLSPDGGEAWSDWDDQSDELTAETPNSEQISTNKESPKLISTPVDASAVVKKTINNDLDSLDVKMAKITAPPLQQVSFKYNSYFRLKIICIIGKG